MGRCNFLLGRHQIAVEQLKKVKQLKAREATTSMRSTLPWRLRVFEKFPTRPQMAVMRKFVRCGLNFIKLQVFRADSDFPMPKVRGSFTHQFAVDHSLETTDVMETG